MLHLAPRHGMHACMHPLKCVAVAAWARQACGQAPLYGLAWPGAPPHACITKLAAGPGPGPGSAHRHGGGGHQWMQSSGGGPPCCSCPHGSCMHCQTARAEMWPHACMPHACGAQHVTGLFSEVRQSCFSWLLPGSSDLTAATQHAHRLFQPLLSCASCSSFSYRSAAAGVGKLGVYVLLHVDWPSKCAPMKPACTCQDVNMLGGERPFQKRWIKQRQSGLVLTMNPSHVT